MWGAVYGVVLLLALPGLVTSSGDGNIKLLEEEVAAAIKACIVPGKEAARQRRSENYGYDDQYTDGSPRIDGNTKTDLNQYSHERRNTSDMKEQIHYTDGSPRIDGNTKTDLNQYSHERRNTSDMKEQIHVLNATDYDYGGKKSKLQKLSTWTYSDQQYHTQYTDGSARIDGNSKNDLNQYSHERRNSSDMKEQIHVLNATDYDYGGYGAGNQGEKFVNSAPKPAGGGSYNESTSVNRTRRNEPLLDKGDNDQCLSQCVFANLQVVDSRGIPREAELWNKVQGAVTSQQSRTALKDQLRACFQELQSEAEDNGCSYSNKLERCLMLRFSDRSKADDAQVTTEATQKT
ncbi:hypothetical protein NE865_05047 [Phthorimaea operculella]|nr:hypothetical protein NE865_05047 [Phthorimaea operculella]